MSKTKKQIIEQNYYQDIETILMENKLATLEQDIAIVYAINQRYAYLCGIESIEMDFGITQQDMGVELC